jgi:hypothetical protein
MRGKGQETMRPCRLALGWQCGWLRTVYLIWRSAPFSARRMSQERKSVCVSVFFK